MKKQNQGKKSTTSCDNTMHQPEMLHIAVISEDLRLPLDEGAKKTSFHLIRSLINKAAKVSVYSRYENPILKDAFQLPGNKLLIGNQFSRQLRAQAPDFILYIPNSSGTIGAFIRAVMIKTQSRGTPLALLNLQYRRLPVIARYFGLHRIIDIVFTQSQASTEVFRSFGCNTVFLTGGVDGNTFRPAGKQEKHLLRMKYGFQDSDQIILHVGHCKRDRNVIALASLVKSGFKMILIASTSTSVDADLLSALRVAGVHVITDYLENIEHFYQMADCYLFPVVDRTSAIDAPLSVLEAMACNLPVVTTPFGALPGMFQPGKGFHYWDSDGDPAALIKEAIDEPDCRTVEKVSPYSWDYTVSTILETFRGIRQI